MTCFFFEDSMLAYLLCNIVQAEAIGRADSRRYINCSASVRWLHSMHSLTHPSFPALEAPM